MGNVNEPLSNAISSASIRTCAEFMPRDLVHMSRAFAQLQYIDAPLFHALSAAALRRRSELTIGFDLEASAWSVSARRYTNEPFCHALAASARRTLSQYDVLSLSNIAWAYAACVC